MTKEEALTQCNQLIEDRASRSKVCSFLNSLDSAKLITSKRADALADVLESDRSNNMPVLRSILQDLNAIA